MLSNYQPSKRDYLKRLYYIIVEKGEISQEQESDA